jgi:hypothetical protein
VHFHTVLGYAGSDLLFSGRYIWQLPLSDRKKFYGGGNADPPQRQVYPSVFVASYNFLFMKTQPLSKRCDR